MKSKRGNVINYIVSVTLLIIFAVAVVAIVVTVYHVSLLPSGSVTSASSTPVPCQISLVNASTSSKLYYWNVTVDEGSPGLTYTVYLVQSSSASLLGTYIAGESIFTKTIQVPGGKGSFIGNTTGSSKAVNGNTYSSGGECQATV